MKRNDTTLEQSVFNVNGTVRFTVGRNDSGRKVIWVDSYDSYCGIHTKAEYKAFKKELLKTLKQLDKLEKVLGTK